MIIQICLNELDILEDTHIRVFLRRHNLQTFFFYDVTSLEKSASRLTYNLFRLLMSYTSFILNDPYKHVFEVFNIY